MIESEEAVFAKHLLRADGAEQLEAHIRAGGTTDTYLAAWRTQRDEAAAAVTVSPQTARQVLDLPVPRWEPDATVRDYLTALLARLWDGEADPTYGMAGNSDWRYDIYEALLTAGLIRSWKDGWGVGYRDDDQHHREDVHRADRLVFAAIEALHGTE